LSLQFCGVGEVGVVQIKGYWARAGLPIALLGINLCVRACMISPLAENYRLLRPFDVCSRRNLDLGPGGLQSFEFVIEDVTGYSPRVLNDAAEEVVEDCLCSLEEQVQRRDLCFLEELEAWWGEGAALSS
jgi:hypothetical protein